MPKERKTRSISFEARSRASPFPCSSSSSLHKGSSSSSLHNPPESPVPTTKDRKEWDEVRCPVCMEHPHNAVLLTCASSDKGCQPFMCDTSYRHSNCLDQYKKAFTETSSPEETVVDLEQSNFACPLCRGGVTGWKVVETARRYMNSKARSCSKESCGFTGTYGDLRKHARKEHPSVRPSEADPERQSDWRRMEQRRDLGDLFSTMQSAMGGEDGGLGGFIEDDEELGMRSIFRISSMAVFFIFSFTSTGGVGRGRARGLSTRSPSRSRRGRRRLLWGETYSEPRSEDAVINSGNTDDDDEGDYDGGGDSGSNVGGSNEVAAASSSRRGRGRPQRRQLRMSDDEMDGDDSDLL